jgi:ElaB/YqjD/DUF883 family membrane-anchored ribosome-binding protein
VDQLVASGIHIAQGNFTKWQRIEEATMKAEAPDRVTDLSSVAAQIQAGVARVKEAAADAAEGGIATCKRSFKQNRRVADDLVDDAEHYVKRNPLSTVGTALGVGLGLGAAIGFLLSRTLCSGR